MMAAECRDSLPLIFFLILCLTIFASLVIYQYNKMVAGASL